MFVKCPVILVTRCIISWNQSQFILNAAGFVCFLNREALVEISRCALIHSSIHQAVCVGGLSSWNQNTVISFTVTKPPFCPHDSVSEWVGQSSEGKVTESQPHAEPSAPLFSFLHWGWNLDRAAGTPRCCANGSHRLGSNTAGAWMSAMATMTERHSATMSEQLFSKLLSKMTWS